MKASPDVQRLLDRGVVMPEPSTVYVDPLIDPGLVAPGVVIHPGCRIRGPQTSIGPGCVIGAEAPATVDNCQLGEFVRLSGGFFSGATCLEGVVAGSAAHVRPGSLLEEGASIAHAVGLKQTLLMPFVTLGSLINFCDVLMAGGTGARNHGEVGSSYLHFNFTPQQDKATPSLIGDVPRGVMLDQPPVFLGGQGGMVGPRRIEFGTVVAAGAVLREDVPEPSRMVYPAAQPAGRSEPREPGVYKDIRRKVAANLAYIGNLRALQVWYRQVRVLSMSRTSHGEACCQGAICRIDEMLIERMARLAEFRDKLPASMQRLQSAGASTAALVAFQRNFHERWPWIHEQLSAPPPEGLGEAFRDRFLRAYEAVADSAHVQAIQSLPPDVRAAGTGWLQAVVDSYAGAWKPTAS